MGNTFCDGIDKALAPVGLAVKVSRGLLGLLLLSFVVVMVVTVGGPDGPDPDMFGISGLGGVFLALFVGSIIFLYYQQGRARLALQKVCSVTSEQQPRLSFHVRYETSY